MPDEHLASLPGPARPAEPPGPAGGLARPAGPGGREGFRAMMRGFPTGVAIVTALDLAGRPWGMTCSSVCSVTMDPPTLLVCLRSGSPTLDAVVRRGEFAVNLLDDGAQATAELFASGDPHRFDRVGWHLGDGAAGPHLPEDAHAVADCRAGMRLPVGDHVVVFGEVREVVNRTGRRPLLYGLRRYSAWPHP
ncbi:flavin reductase family protein [Actinomadura rupiterrae]|uniref:flavin reductase family protein n=1 Tax=Actinomadura rupiterrae TaxID=559627 RepID=UPI0020A2E0F9|nr:flavin reductase family protein [Actinomadura rupiterrae]